jgi:alpha-tubulin suppressor-like RCC1 family protein
MYGNITDSKQVYSWGVGSQGQLGHGHGKMNCSVVLPRIIDELARIPFKSVACGPFYSVAVTGIAFYFVILDHMIGDEY